MSAEKKALQAKIQENKIKLKWSVIVHFLLYIIP
jgi:hypothetical protein